jgi:thiamine pyrophosphate-dependent acetolactate synthase large subunit-like protein
MLDTEQFLDGLVRRQFSHLCVVPCSFASSLINAAINHPEIDYLPAASEAVACSVAAGIKMSGGKPLVIIQSSGLTNMGSCITSLLRPYDISVAMLVSWRSYSEGDSEIQHQHLATELPALVAAYGGRWEIIDASVESLALDQLDASDGDGRVLLLEADSFSNVELADEHKLDVDGYPTRMAYLARLPELLDDECVLIGTTGNTAREMYGCLPDRRNFYMAGNMGGALSLGLGASLRGRRVLVCGGDAEFVMHLGGLSTAGRYRDKLGSGRLIYLVFDNESNKSTGGQRSYQDHLDYLAVARACQFDTVAETLTSLESFDAAILTACRQPGPSFLHIKCAYDPVAPRPPAAVIRDSQQAFAALEDGE